MKPVVARLDLGRLEIHRSVIPIRYDNQRGGIHTYRRGNVETPAFSLGPASFCVRDFDPIKLPQCSHGVGAFSRYYPWCARANSQVTRDIANNTIEGATVLMCGGKYAECEIGYNGESLPGVPLSDFA